MAETETKMKVAPTGAKAEAKLTPAEIKEQMREAAHQVNTHKANLKAEIGVMKLEKEHMQLTVDMLRLRYEHDSIANEMNRMMAAKAGDESTTKKDEEPTAK